MSKQKYPQTAARSDNSLGGASRSSTRKSYSHAHADAKKDRKRREADERQFKYDGLTTAQKLKALGSDGSNRQRKRLQALLELEKTPKVKIAPLTQGEKDAKLIANVQAAVAIAPKGGSKKKTAVAA